MSEHTPDRHIETTPKLDKSDARIEDGLVRTLIPPVDPELIRNELKTEAELDEPSLSSEYGVEAGRQSDTTRQALRANREYNGDLDD